MRVATVAASSGSLSATRSSGAGPSGRCARSSTEPGATLPARPPEHEVGQADHLRGGAVVAHQLDGARLGMPGAEAQEVLGRGAGEGVDGLRRVADDADVAPLPEPQVEQGLLEPVDVLVLVDDEVPVLAADGTGDLLVLAQDADHEEQDVLEVDDAALGLDLLVGGDEPGHGGGVEPGRGLPTTGGGGRGIRLGREERDLRPLDLGGEVAHGRPVEPQAQARPGLGHGARLVRHDLGGGAADGLRPEVVQLAEGRRVERAGLHAADAEVAQPGAHLAGGAGGEGDGEDALRLVDAGQHAVGDAVGDGPGLAGAGARQHAHRAAGVRRDLALLGVEGVEDRVGSGVHGQRRHRRRS